MAPRQYQRKIKTGSARFEDVYRAVSGYRSQYPGKAVVYSAQKAPEMAWASLMAGGSCAAVPVKDEAFLKVIATMQVDSSRAKDGIYRLYGPQGELIFNESHHAVPVDNKLKIFTIDAKSGALTSQKQRGSIDKGLYWLKR
jgi:hypothetical protein